MRTPSEAAVGPCDDALPADALNEPLDPLRDELRMLDDVGGMGDDPRDDDLSVRQLHSFPDDVFVLVPRVRRFEEIGPCFDLQHEVDDMDHLEIERVGSMPASPAEVVANPLLRDVPQRMVECVDPQFAVLSVAVEPHRDPDPVPEGGEPCVVALVVFVAAVHFETRRGRRGQERIARIDEAREDRDLPFESRLTRVCYRRDANPVRTRVAHLRRLVEEGPPLACVAIKSGELFSVSSLCDQRLPAERRTRLEAAEAVVHVGKPISAFRVLALVDDVEADLTLLANDLFDRGAQARLVPGDVGLDPFGQRKATDMRRQYLVRAASHHSTLLTLAGRTCL